MLVEDLETARVAVEGGATVVQLRLKARSTDEVVERGRGFAELPATFVVNDDVEAALRLEAHGVHLGRGDEGAERALESGLLLGLSAASVQEAREAEGPLRPRTKTTSPRPRCRWRGPGRGSRGG